MPKQRWHPSLGMGRPWSCWCGHLDAKAFPTVRRPLSPSSRSPSVAPELLRWPSGSPANVGGRPPTGTAGCPRLPRWGEELRDLSESWVRSAWCCSGTRRLYSGSARPSSSQEGMPTRMQPRHWHGCMCGPAMPRMPWMCTGLRWVQRQTTWPCTAAMGNCCSSKAVVRMPSMRCSRAPNWHPLRRQQSCIFMWPSYSRISGRQGRLFGLGNQR
mmetsp:Transcript_67512/g.174880  ORF Transcript_67512/g.174880 Transcript_67512/m.174880 type:complete len:214 (-) Transcript_67512:427-1068(-)